MWVLWYLAISAFFALIFSYLEIHAAETKDGPVIQPTWLSYMVGGILWPIFLILWLLFVGGMIVFMVGVVLILVFTMCGAFCVEIWNQIRRKRYDG